MKTIIAIDPGKKGALASMNPRGEIVEIIDMPIIAKEVDYAEVEKFIKSKLGSILIVIEKQQAYPGQGSVSIFNFAKHYGYLLGLIVASRLPIEIIHPKTWQKEFSLIFTKKHNLTKKQKKEKSILKARELFPDIANQLLISKDGRADACLLAEYARRKKL